MNLHTFIATSPVDINHLFAQALNAGDIKGLLALYEPNACLISRTGEQHVGSQAIKAYLCDILAFKGHMTAENQYVYRVGEIALLSVKWHFVGTRPNGEPLDLHGISAEVVRQQPDGRWLYIIDHPFGCEGQTLHL